MAENISRHTRQLDVVWEAIKDETSHQLALYGTCENCSG